MTTSPTPFVESNLFLCALEDDDESGRKLVDTLFPTEKIKIEGACRRLLYWIQDSYALENGNEK